MELILLIVCVIMLGTIITFLARMHRKIGEIQRIQIESTKPETLQRIMTIDRETELFERFIDEDFSRSELPEEEQEVEFQRWKIANR